MEKKVEDEMETGFVGSIGRITILWSYLGPYLRPQA